MRVFGFPDLTIDTLRELFGDARIPIQHALSTVGHYTVGLYHRDNTMHRYWTFDKQKACQEPIASITFTVADLHGNPYIYADMLMQEVWKREFPVSSKLREIQELSQKCGELMEWLETKDIHLGKYHEHTEECSDPVVWGLPEGTRNHYCGLSEGVLYPETISMTRLLAEFFGIDLKALEAEKERMLEEARS
jgi:hypothetical protein